MNSMSVRLGTAHREIADLQRKIDRLEAQLETQLNQGSKMFMECTEQTETIERLVAALMKVRPLVWGDARVILIINAALAEHRTHDKVTEIKGESK